MISPPTPEPTPSPGVNDQHQTGILLLVGAALLWSSGGVLIKSIDWSPPAIAGARSGIAFLTILALSKRKPEFTWSKPQLGAAAAYATTVLTFVLATKLTTAANAILLQYTAPVYVALFGSWYLGEPANRLDWAALLVVFVGMVLFFMDDLTLTGWWGNILGVVSGVSFGWMALFLRKQKSGSPLESVLIGNGATFLVCLPFMFGPAPSLSALGPLIALGVLQLGVSYILFTRAIRHVRALDAILIPVIEPVLNPIWVLFLLGERPGGWALLGGLVVLVGVVGRGVIAKGLRGRRVKGVLNT